MRFTRHERRILRQLAADLADCPDDLAVRLVPAPWCRVETWMLAFAGYIPCGALAYVEHQMAAMPPEVDHSAPARAS